MNKKITTICARILVALLATHSICSFAGMITVADAKKRMIAQLVEAGFEPEISSAITHDNQSWESKSADGFIDEKEVDQSIAEIVATLNETQRVPARTHTDNYTITLQDAIAEATFRIACLSFNPSYTMHLKQNVIDALVACAVERNPDGFHQALVSTSQEVFSIIKEQISILDKCLEPHNPSEQAAKNSLQTITSTPLTVASIIDAQPLAVESQRGVTCGYHAVFNARAIQELVNKGEAITSESVKAIAKKYHHLITNENVQLLYHQVNSLANSDAVKLSQFHIIAYNESTKQIWPSGYGADTPPSLNAFFTKIVREQLPVAHLICNIDESHWISFSIINTADKGLQIIHLDSMVPHRIDQRAQIYVDYIQKSLMEAASNALPVENYAIVPYSQEELDALLAIEDKPSAPDTPVMSATHQETSAEEQLNTLATPTESQSALTYRDVLIGAATFGLGALVANRLMR